MSFYNTNTTRLDGWRHWLNVRMLLGAGSTFLPVKFQTDVGRHAKCAGFSSPVNLSCSVYAQWLWPTACVWIHSVMPKAGLDVHWSQIRSCCFSQRRVYGCSSQSHGIELFVSREWNERENHHLMKKEWLKKEVTFSAYLYFLIQGLSTIFLPSQHIFPHVSLRTSAIILYKATKMADYSGHERAANGYGVQVKSRVLQKVDMAKPKCCTWLKRLHVIKKCHCSANRKLTWKEG